tara:strand:+ start:28 stop:243 length:216 start_codon:yes stop_codon:yes gene_type:complete
MKIVPGDSVFLKAPVQYLITNENIPTLRPPDLVKLDEIGVVISEKDDDVLEVSFRRGTFLVNKAKLSIISS